MTHYQQMQVIYLSIIFSIMGLAKLLVHLSNKKDAKKSLVNNKN